MNASDLSRVIETVGKDRGIKKEVIIGALEQAVLAAAQKKLGPTVSLEAHYNNDSGEIDLYQFKKVVESEPEMLEESEEIDINDAVELDPDASLGDEIGVKLESQAFGRIDAQTAKQVIFQKVRDAEREIIYNEYIERKGEIITGIARRVERGNLVIDLGKADALLPRGEIIPGEQFRPGDRVQAFLNDVVLTNRGPHLYLSRTTPRYLMSLFEIEVPEIRDEIVEIKNCVREPGQRAKIAVTSNDRDVDPVGACVGMKGVRVQNVIAELKGEKIDIIPWSDNPVIFVRSALAPAEISGIRVDETSQSMEIMVEDDQLSLAIGRKGQNVRLAAQLTGWRLDIISKTKLQERTNEAIFNLQHLEGVNETLAHAIYQAGFVNVRAVSEAEITALQAVPGFEEEAAAEKLKADAASLYEKMGDAIGGAEKTEGKPSGAFTANPAVSSRKSAGMSAAGATTPSGTGDAKSAAEARLQEMLKAQTSPESSDSEADSESKPEGEDA